MKQFKHIMTILLVMVLMTSCSSVFNGGFTGTIKEDKGGLDDSSNTGISGATVFIYTDEGARNADYEAAVAPSSVKPSRYTASTVTNDNGQFSVSKILWQTSSPAFGKTADRISLYMIIYKAGFGVNGYNKNSNAITIASDSTNESTYTEAFPRTMKSTTVSFSLTNIISGGAAVSDPLSVKLSDLEALDGSCTISKTSSDNTFDVSYRNEESAAPRIKIKNYAIQNADGASTWVICDKEGKSFAPVEKSVYTSQGAQTINLYAKQTEFTFPTVTGRYSTTGEGEDIGTAEADGLQVSLYLENEAGEKTILGTAITEPQQISQNRVRHGNFSISSDQNIKWHSIQYEGLYAPYSGNDEHYSLILLIESSAPIEIDLTESYTSKDSQLDLGDITTT